MRWYFNLKYIQSKYIKYDISGIEDCDDVEYKVSKIQQLDRMIKMLNFTYLDFS